MNVNKLRMNVNKLVYIQKDLNVPSNLAQHKKYNLKNAFGKKYSKLWILCEQMEEKAMKEFDKANNLKSRIKAFFQSANSTYLLRNGYDSIFQKMELKEMCVFVSQEQIFAQYDERNHLCYQSVFQIDKLSVTVKFEFHKRQ